MMMTGNHKGYAEKRFKTHLTRFHKLSEQLRRGKLDEAFLADLEEKDNLFSNIETKAFEIDENRG
jgi:1,4-alpha-glucan branching enzyme